MLENFDICISVPLKVVEDMLIHSTSLVRPQLKDA